MNAGHPATNFIVTGNVLHYDSLLANLLEPICNPGWIAKKYKAIEKFSDRPELWEQWSYWDLEVAARFHGGREDFVYLS